MTGKTVLIVGKGPSAQVVDRDDDRVVCCLNGSVRFVGRCDWLFVNDFSSLEEISESCIGITDNVVVPSELHQDTAGRRTLPFDQLPDWFAEWPCLHIYQLPSAKRKRSDIPDFGRIQSVGETCVAWMLHQGYRDFETTGIDPGGGYHPAFAGGRQVTNKPGSWYRRNWRRMRDRVEMHGGTIRRIEVGKDEK